MTAYAPVRAVAANVGDTVIVSAAAGGVGEITVQLLRVRGATVVAIASLHNHDWLCSKGAIPVAYGEGAAVVTGRDIALVSGGRITSVYTFIDR